LNYPWDTWQRRHTDDSWLIQTCREYADSAQANSPSGYMTAYNNGITNGYDWYSIAGGRQDHVTYFHGGREVTIELSNSHLIDPSLLPAHWDYNRAAFITYIEQANYGIRGIVTNQSNGDPLEAMITVIEHDHQPDSSMVFSDPDHGDYYRLIDDGTYMLAFSAIGFIPDTGSNVVVVDRQATIVNVQLVPLSNDPIIGFSDHDAGIVDPGDDVNMNLTLVNNGGGDAVGVTGLLSTDDTFITITQSSSTYPMIDALGGMATSQQTYNFTVANECPFGYEAQFRLDVTDSGDYVDSLFFSVVIGLQIEDFETNDFSMFDWQMSGDAYWYIVSDDQFEGQYSAKSGMISHNDTSSLSIDFDANSDGELSFAFKVSSESGYDYFQFFIDNQLENEWAGEVGWTEVDYIISEGQHNFKWTYGKDGSVSDGGDCAWLDYIVFPISTPTFEPGDANGSSYANGLDVTYLVSHLKGNGPPPYIYLAGDANGDCDVNGLDVSYLVLYFKGDGAAPIIGDCP